MYDYAGVAPDYNIILIKKVLKKSNYILAAN